MLAVVATSDIKYAMAGEEGGHKQTGIIGIDDEAETLSEGGAQDR